MTRFALLLTLAACGTSDTDPESDTDVVVDDGVCPADETCVRIETSMGEMVVQLAMTEAPITSENFLGYVDSGFYDGKDTLGSTIFHRVMDGFMIQGGGFTPEGTQKSTLAPIVLESNVGLSNVRGTIAMARTNNPNSATTQFFVNHANNPNLDYQSEAMPGYAVFGELIDGMDTLDAIATTPVDAANPNSPAPITQVVITACERVD